MHKNKTLLFPFIHIIFAFNIQLVTPLILNADDWLKILSIQKLYGNVVEVAVRYPHEPGYDMMRVVVINCNTKGLKGQDGRDMSPGLIKMIASKVCKN